MAWIRTVPPGEASGELREAYEGVAKSRGKVANVVAVHGLNPRALNAMMDLYLAIMYGPSPLPRSQREMIATAVSSANGCGYCVSHHAEALRVTAKDDARRRITCSLWATNQRGERVLTHGLAEAEL